MILEEQLRQKDALILRMHFALLDAWPYIHQSCSIKSIYNEIDSLCRPSPRVLPPTAPYDPKQGFDELWRVLGWVHRIATGTAPGADSDSLQSKLNRICLWTEKFRQGPAPETATAFWQCPCCESYYTSERVVCPVSGDNRPAQSEPVPHD